MITTPHSDPTNGKQPSWKARTRTNLLALGISKGVAGLVSVVVVAYLARALGPSAYGILGFGVALRSYFILFVRLGIPPLATREIARAPGQAMNLAGQFLGMQLTLAFIGFVAYALLVLALPKPTVFKTVLLIQGIGLFAHGTSLEWLFLGLQKTWELAARNSAASLLHLAAVLVFVHNPEDVALAATASVAGLLVGSGWLITASYRQFGLPRVRIDLETWKTHLKPALPIAASTFLIAVYYNLDLVMLGLIRSEAEVGWYTAGYKGFTAALIPAMVIAHSFFPALSVSKDSLIAKRERMRSYARAMLLVGLPIAAGASILGRPLLALYAGAEFEPATFAFMLIMVNVGFVYLNMILGHPLIAWDKQATYMYVVGSGAVLNVVLNIVLIPPHGINGAAIATVTTEAIVLLGLAYQHYRITHQLYGELLVRTFVAVIVGIITPASFYHLGILPFWFVLILLPITYGVAAKVLKLIPPTGVLTILR